MLIVSEQSIRNLLSFKPQTNSNGRYKFEIYSPKTSSKTSIRTCLYLYNQKNTNPVVFTRSTISTNFHPPACDYILRFDKQVPFLVREEAPKIQVSFNPNHRKGLILEYGRERPADQCQIVRRVEMWYTSKD